MTDAPELKPCPFCGGEAKRDTLGPDEYGNEGGDVIECTSCGASSHVEFGFKENLASVWNTRAIDRNAILEEAAKVAERYSAAYAVPPPSDMDNDESEYFLDGARDGATAVAAAIRAMKEAK